VLFGFFVTTLAKRLAGKIIFMVTFMSKGFPDKVQIEELFIVMVSFCVFPARNVLYFLIEGNFYFHFLNAAYFIKTRYSLFVLKVPLNPSQSIDHELAHV